MLLFCLCRSERSVPLLPLYALLQSFVARSALVPLQSVAIPETALIVDSLLLCHYNQIVIQPVHASFPVLLFWARVQPVHYWWDIHDHSYVCVAAVSAHVSKGSVVWSGSSELSVPALTRVQDVMQCVVSCILQDLFLRSSDKGNVVCFRLLLKCRDTSSLLRYEWHGWRGPRRNNMSVYGCDKDMRRDRTSRVCASSGLNHDAMRVACPCLFFCRRDTLALRKV